MAADAISFFRIERVGLTAVIRRSGRAWKKRVTDFGESVYFCPAVARAVASGTQPKLHVGRHLGHHARTGSIVIMTTDGAVKVAGGRRMNVESQWYDNSWSALREQMEHDPEGHEGLQVHQRRRDLKPEIETHRAPGK